MSTRRAIASLGMLVMTFVVSASAYAQTEPGQKPFEPQVGQAGKDVVWVPTPQAVVDKMLDMAAVTKNDFVMDLGSGDGRTVITAAKRGARAMGIEYNPDMVDLSQKNAAAEGVSARATFVKADLFETDFSKANVITMFLLPSINMKLRPKILDLRPGTRIASNTFTMEDWQADETATVSDGCSSSWCTALFWIVPAKVEGTWRMPNGQLKLTQTFQMISGTLGNQAVQGRLRGAEITFTSRDTKYSGTVAGNTITLTSPKAMTATREGRATTMTARSAAPAATPSASGAATYTVNAGDTLGGIAQAQLGRRSAYTKIFEANKGILTDPNRISVGQVLTIPRD